MNSISFGWTWPAFAMLEKTVTRRDWKEQHAKKFRPGVQFEALDKDRRYGGKVIGYGEIVAEVRREPLSQMPDSDYLFEGFGFFAQHPECLPQGAKDRDWCQDNCSLESFKQWRHSGDQLYVVRFSVLRVTDEARNLVEKMIRDARQSKPKQTGAK